MVTLSVLPDVSVVHGQPVHIADPRIGCASILAKRRFCPGWCCCGTCSESVCHHQLTLDIYIEILTFVSIGTFLLSGSASLAVALLVENAVIVLLLKGEPLAIFDVVALFNACLEGGYFIVRSGGDFHE